MSELFSGLAKIMLFLEDPPGVPEIQPPLEEVGEPQSTFDYAFDRTAKKPIRIEGGTEVTCDNTVYYVEEDGREILGAEKCADVRARDKVLIVSLLMNQAVRNARQICDVLDGCPPKVSRLVYRRWKCVEIPPGEEREQGVIILTESHVGVRCRRS